MKKISPTKQIENLINFLFQIIVIIPMSIILKDLSQVGNFNEMLFYCWQMHIGNYSQEVMVITSENNHKWPKTTSDYYQLWIEIVQDQITNFRIPSSLYHQTLLLRNGQWGQHLELKLYWLCQWRHLNCFGRQLELQLQYMFPLWNEQ